MADPSGKVGTGKQGAARKVEKVRTGLPPMVRGDQQDGSEKSASFKTPTKPKAKDTLRDGAPKTKK